MDLLMSIRAINAVEWITLLFALFGVAQVIVRLTPTPEDDKIVSKIGKILSFLFSKTNVSNTDISNLQEKIMHSAIVEAINDEPILGKLIEDRAMGITKTVNNVLDNKIPVEGLEILSSLPQSYLGKRIYSGIKGNIDKRQMKTRIGKTLKRVFQRLS